MTAVAEKVCVVVTFNHQCGPTPVNAALAIILDENGARRIALGLDVAGELPSNPSPKGGAA